MHLPEMPGNALFRWGQMSSLQAQKSTPVGKGRAAWGHFQSSLAVSLGMSFTNKIEVSKQPKHSRNLGHNWSSNKYEGTIHNKHGCHCPWSVTSKSISNKALICPECVWALSIALLWLLSHLAHTSYLSDATLPCEEKQQCLGMTGH